MGRYSQVGFEQSYYSWELTGNWAYLGWNGDWYYACHAPTDVNFNLDHYDDYHATGTALMAWLEELAAGAGLTPMEEDPFYQRVTGPLSYPGGGACDGASIILITACPAMKRRRTRSTPGALPARNPGGGGDLVRRPLCGSERHALSGGAGGRPAHGRLLRRLQEACDAGRAGLSCGSGWRWPWPLRRTPSGRELSPDAFVLRARRPGVLFDLSGHGGAGERSRRLRGQGSSCLQTRRTPRNEGVRLFF